MIYFKPPYLNLDINHENDNQDIKIFYCGYGWGFPSAEGNQCQDERPKRSAAERVGVDRREDLGQRLHDGPDRNNKSGIRSG